MSEVDDRLEGDPIWELFAAPASANEQRRHRPHPLLWWLIAGTLIAAAWLFHSVLAIMAACLSVGARDLRKGRQLARSVSDKGAGTICARFTYAWAAWKVGIAAFVMVWLSFAIFTRANDAGGVPPACGPLMLLSIGAFTLSAVLTASGLVSAYRSDMRVWIGEGVNQVRTLVLHMLIVAFTFVVLGPSSAWLSTRYPRASDSRAFDPLELVLFLGWLFAGPVLILLVLDILSRRVIANRRGKFGPKVSAVGKWNSQVGAALLAAALFSTTGATAGPPATGPLRRLESNPRYFTDGSNRAILLVGSHNWHNFQDNGHRLSGSDDPPPVFDYDGYLDYKDRPSPRYVGKVIVNDTDHLWGHTGGDSVWVWKSFTRGLNVLFMEELLPSPTWQDSARVAMGQVRAFSEKIDLAQMVPTPELSATGYILAARGREYLAYQDGGLGEFWIDLAGTEGNFEVQWYDITKSMSIAAKPVRGGGRRVFTTPFPGPAAVHIKRVGG